MGIWEIFTGVIMGGFIWFMVAGALEDPVLNRINKKKYGEDSSRQLSSDEAKKVFYTPLAIISVLLGILVSYLGSKGLLPN